MACTWFGEISSCSSLTALPGPAWVLLSKICKPFVGSLYLDRTPALTRLFPSRTLFIEVCRSEKATNPSAIVAAH